MKKVKIVILAAIAATSVMAMACDKEDTTSPIQTPTTETATLGGTKWLCHYERTQELNGNTVQFVTNYALTFSDGTNGIYTADVSSTISAGNEITEVSYTYTIDKNGQGVIHYQVPADMPDYVASYFEQEQAFSVSADGSTLSFISAGENLVFTKQ